MLSTFEVFFFNFISAITAFLIMLHFLKRLCVMDSRMTAVGVD